MNDDESSAVITLASGITAYNNDRHMVYKIGRICYINLFLDAFTIPAIWTGIDLGTIPSGYRPKKDCSYINFQTPSLMAQLSINSTTGKIRASNVSGAQGQSSNYFGFDCIYIHA